MPAQPSNAELIACCLIFCQRQGTDGRFIPTPKEMNEILAHPPDRWEEACALGEALSKRLVQNAPKTLIGATLDFAGEINKVQEKFGNFMSSEPVKGRTR
jgi:hypothetical protein